MYLVAVRGREYFVLREYVGQGEQGYAPRTHARAILDMLSEFGRTVHHVTDAYGDTNSAGMLSAGVKYNRLLEREVARILNASSPPLDIAPAQKGPGSVAAGESALNAALLQGRLWVHESCVRLQYSARHYTGREQDLKDPIDALRYALSHELLVPWMGDAVEIRL